MNTRKIWISDVEVEALEFVLKQANWRVDEYESMAATEGR